MRQSAFVPLLFFVASPLLAQELKEFSNGEVADADDVNFNFTLLKDAIDALAVEPTSTIIATEGPPSGCLLYTSPSPRDLSTSRMPSSA